MKKVNSIKDLSVSCAATCLATARSQHGSGVVNTIHYRSAASLPKRRGNRRGFTMVELVIALVIIAIVSLATVSLIITQNNMNLKSTQVIEATNVAENAIECFRFAVNHPVDPEDEDNDPDKDDVIESFEIAFNKTGYELDNDNGEYEIKVHGATIIITITENVIEATHTITITATASDDDEIINTSYTK